MAEQGARAAAYPVALSDLLKEASERGASDLLLQEGEPPRLRIAGRIEPEGHPVLEAGQLSPLFRDTLPERAARRFEEMGSADFSMQGDRERWRVALFLQMGTAGANLRRIPFEVPSLDDWALPPVLKEVTALGDGLVLVTGQAGSGKSSTLAAMAREILETRPVHLVTIEDPVEYILPKGKGVVTQREVGADIPDFAEGLRAAVRQQPDVLIVGEIRDRETADTALNAAETGCLVLSTLHTRSASETIGRLLEMFPDAERKRVLGQLSRILKAVFSQMLVERVGGGQVAAVEVLRHSPSVEQRILSGDIGGLYEEIQSSVPYHRMQSMNQSLAALVLTGVVSREEAVRRSPRPDDLDLLVRSAELVPLKEDPMAECFSDYSKIHEMQEMKRLHDEELARHAEAEGHLQKRIEKLEKEVAAREEALIRGKMRLACLEDDWMKEREKLVERRKQLEIVMGRLQRQSSKIRQKSDRAAWWKRLFRPGRD